MEVADQWRREWAGTAEFGKVTEGGVTRRVARAMEVLHASGPGARVRVMRAAYHSSAGPGAPAESFMLHSSRRVFSSGFNFLESPSLPTKPLEISSTPFDYAHDSNGETENYKVTEPDDLDISEPSKWKGSTRGSSIRMPSEESSSTDNASIVDLDSRSRNLHRKYSYDSECSDLQFRSRSNSRTSQIIDAPTTLSTLKYKSLLNNSNEWNCRRKSYSFEDTSPLNETILHSNDTLAMESSTDSGICKSTEIMNDHVDDNSHIKYYSKEDRKPSNKEESFRDWLSKNRQNVQYRGTKFKTYREHEVVMEDPKENNIALQSPGKVSITLPITIESDNENYTRKMQITEDEKRVKKVEFCKTEVHFAAESGKVNIIATDEKPPPSNDFRKRRSAFVPMQDMIDRPITLFGEKKEFPELNGIETSVTHSNSDFNETDENTAATKSILKNKIPKPKPYLLGENMEFGTNDEISNKNTNNCVLTAVSLVNQQLESEKRFKSETKSIFSKETERNIVNSNVFRTINEGPTNNRSLRHEKQGMTNIKIEKPKVEIAETVKNKFSSLQVCADQTKPKTRQLRKSDLTYFGIDNDRKVTQENKIKHIDKKLTRENVENMFHSVKLIQQVSNSVSNSVCNSEHESEEAEYQNIPLNLKFAPVPTPRLRTKFDEPNEISEVKAGLKPIIEKDDTEPKSYMKSSTRRSKARRQETETKVSRSISEPPKNFKLNSLERAEQREDRSFRARQYQLEKNNSKAGNKELSINDRKLSEEEIPLYVNINIDTEKPALIDIDKPNTYSITSQKGQHMNSIKIKPEKISRTPTTNHKHRTKENQSDSYASENSLRKKHSSNKDTVSSSLKREVRPERGITHNNNEARRKLSGETSPNKHSQNSRNNKYINEQSNSLEKKEHKSRSSQRSLPKSTSSGSAEISRDHGVNKREDSSHRKRNSSKDKSYSIHENIKIPPTPEYDHKSHSLTQIKNMDKERDYGSKSSSKVNKHREYVINYDDKNGTVSSICKIKPSLGTPRRKKYSKELLKDNHKDTVTKTKTVDKIALRK